MSTSWPPGPSRPIAPSAEVHVWRANLAAGAWPSHKRLPETERELAERMRRPVVRERWARSRWALRNALSRYLEEDSEAIVLRIGGHAKPALAAADPGLCFNLSTPETLP